MRYPAYPAYKDSGVAWLGDVPLHWQVKPLKTVTNLISRGISPTYVEESRIKVVSQACIQYEGLKLENVKFHDDSNPEGQRGKLFPGDVLINSTGTGTLGRTALFEHGEGYFADGHITVVRPTSPTQSKFLRYFLSTTLVQGYIYSAIVTGSTNQVELSREGLRNTPSFYPPLPEQAAIAAFLDRETAKIAALIARQERMIALLGEKRQALIAHAVTKGLRADAPMKDSGVAWLVQCSGTSLPVHATRALP